MTNHIHTIVVPQSETALSEAFRDTHSIYDQLEAIRMATTRDFPLGEDSFVLQLEARLGRPLRPQKRGPKVETREADRLGQLKFSE